MSVHQFNNIIKSDILFAAVTNYILFNCTYHITSAIFFLIDYFKCFVNNKIQYDYNLIISYYKKCFWCVLLNTFIFSLIPIFIVSLFEVQNPQFFDLTKCFIDIICILFLTDIFFYSIHRLLHCPWLYTYIHKKHHQIIAPIGFSAIYMTPIDFLIGNALPVYFPLYLVGAHGITIKLWIIFTTINTIIFSHSGFKSLAFYHDIHHSHFNKNYGINLFMDRLLDTSVN